MNIETATYIVRFFPRLLSEAEVDAIRHSNSMFKLLPKENSSSAESYDLKVKWFKERKLISDDPNVLDLLNKGNDHFIVNAAERIVRETPQKVFLNFCPNCKELARTPFARQCRQCGLSWREQIAATFVVKRVLQIGARPDSLFFVGDLKTGVLAFGMKIDLTFFGVSLKPPIESIDFADNIAERRSEISLGVKISLTDDQDFLLRQSVMLTPVIIEKGHPL